MASSSAARWSSWPSRAATIQTRPWPASRRSWRRPRADPRTTLTFWQRTLGYSLLFDFVLRRLDLLHNWFGDHVRVHPAGTGERIACALTQRLADLQLVDQLPRSHMCACQKL